jgi:DNA-binding transcriptional regulator YdaS (Cro superfamily)
MEQLTNALIHSFASQSRSELRRDLNPNQLRRVATLGQKRQHG